MKNFKLSSIFLLLSLTTLSSGCFFEDTYVRVDDIRRYRATSDYLASIELRVKNVEDPVFQAGWEVRLYRDNRLIDRGGGYIGHMRRGEIAYTDAFLGGVYDHDEYDKAEFQIYWWDEYDTYCAHNFTEYYHRY